MVKAGDNLPALCYDVYGNPDYYLDVANANQIADFRNLVPGTSIMFPPLEK
jgi:nucleoid-associated protein YgaU